MDRYVCCSSSFNIYGDNSSLCSNMWKDERWLAMVAARQRSKKRSRYVTGRNRVSRRRV